MTYAGVELILRVARVDLRHHIDRATMAVVSLRPDTRRLSDVASSSTAGRKFTVNGLALDAFAHKAAVCVNAGVRANVASACVHSQLLLLRNSVVMNAPPRPVE
jgi:hypothetical protein